MTLLKLVAKKSQLEAIMLTVLDVSIHPEHSSSLHCPKVCTAHIESNSTTVFDIMSIEHVSVLQANTSALKLYTKLGYKPHATSPSQADPVGHLEEPTGYEILSLPLGNK